ncbi:MAG: DUF262 domain-containing protein [Candidatus Electrothrix sp.]
MEASPSKVIQYFNGEKQNLIPLFQRPYTWKEHNWRTLWDDVMVQYDAGDTNTHFMGAIVSVPARSVPVGVNKYLIIDGQQRLTTISLLLCALRDCLDDNSAARIQEVYLTNRFRDIDDTLKFVPTQADRDVYRTIALDRQIPEDDSLIIKAYQFFFKKLRKSHDANDEPVRPDQVLTTLEQNLQVVMINIGDTDDPYLIFESLNFKGEPLTQADLVRNYLLMRFHHSIFAGGEQERVYSKYWLPLEKTLDNNLTEFLRHYMMKDGDNIKQGGIYAAIKDKLKGLGSTQAVEQELQVMQTFGDLYAKILLITHEEEITVRNRLENIKELKVTTSYPLLLRLLHARQTGLLNSTELEKCLGLVESFVVRRTVCRVPTNALNKLFVQWAKNFPDSDHIQWLQDAMLSGAGSRRFPDNDEFTEHFKNTPQYGSGTTRYILLRLEKSFKHKETVDLTSTTIEHVLPQKLTSKWLTELGKDADKIHSRIADTFGNLTLTGYNSELSNLPFTEKKEKLSNTHIELNRWIIEQTDWGEKEVKNRGEELFKIAKSIWNDPLAP